MGIVSEMKNQTTTITTNKQKEFQEHSRTDKYATMQKNKTKYRKSNRANKRIE